VHAYNLSKDGSRLFRAAELYEQAWANSAAKWALEVVAKQPEYAAEAAARLARLAERPEIPDATQERVDTLLSQAHAQLIAGNTAAAESTVQAAGQVAWTRNALLLSATLAWKRGDNTPREHGDDAIPEQLVTQRDETAQRGEGDRELELHAPTSSALAAGTLSALCDGGLSR
jgi:ATP/maltotriose-dependent transcriptional regulator MalT